MMQVANTILNQIAANLSSVNDMNDAEVTKVVYSTDESDVIGNIVDVKVEEDILVHSMADMITMRVAGCNAEWIGKWFDYWCDKNITYESFCKRRQKFVVDYGDHSESIILTNGILVLNGLGDLYYKHILRLNQARPLIVSCPSSTLPISNRVIRVPIWGICLTNIDIDLFISIWVQRLIDSCMACIFLPHFGYEKFFQGTALSHVLSKLFNLAQNEQVCQKEVIITFPVPEQTIPLVLKVFPRVAFVIVAQNAETSPEELRQKYPGTKLTFWPTTCEPCGNDRFHKFNSSTGTICFT